MTMAGVLLWQKCVCVWAVCFIGHSCTRYRPTEAPPYLAGISNSMQQSSTPHTERNDIMAVLRDVVNRIGVASL